MNGVATWDGGRFEGLVVCVYGVGWVGGWEG